MCVCVCVCVELLQMNLLKARALFRSMWEHNNYMNLTFGAECLKRSVVSFQCVRGGVAWCAITVEGGRYPASLYCNKVATHT